MPTDDDRIDPRFERDFTRALSLAGEDYAVPVEPLIAAARVRGRGLRRRRTASIAAGVAVLAVIGAGGVFAAGPGAGSAGPAAGAASAAAHPSMSGEEVLALLTASLPTGTTEVAQALGTEGGFTQIRLVLDDGRGPAQLLFSITDGPAAFADRGCASDPAPDECTAETLPDGSSLLLYQAATRQDEPAGAKTWSATLATPDGHRVMLQEWNRKPLDRGTPVTRTDPPLTTSQLKALVTDQKWQPVMAALPPLVVPAGRPATGGARPSQNGTPPSGAVGVAPSGTHTAGTAPGDPASAALLAAAASPAP